MIIFIGRWSFTRHKLIQSACQFFCFAVNGLISKKFVFQGVIWHVSCNFSGVTVYTYICNLLVNQVTQDALFKVKSDGCPFNIGEPAHITEIR